MTLPLPCDPHLAAQLRALIDPCELRAVKRYVRNPTSEIQLVVLVQDGYALEEVAAVFASPGSGEAVLQALLTQGVIKFGVDDLGCVQATVRECAVLLDSIPDQQDCFIIYLPPCHVVQLHNRTRARVGMNGCDRGAGQRGL